MKCLGVDRRLRTVWNSYSIYGVKNYGTFQEIKPPAKNIFYLLQDGYNHMYIYAYVSCVYMLALSGSKCNERGQNNNFKHAMNFCTVKGYHAIFYPTICAAWYDPICSRTRYQRYLQSKNSFHKDSWFVGHTLIGLTAHLIVLGKCFGRDVATRVRPIHRPHVV